MCESLEVFCRKMKLESQKNVVMMFLKLDGHSPTKPVTSYLASWPFLHLTFADFSGFYKLQNNYFSLVTVIAWQYSHQHFFCWVSIEFEETFRFNIPAMVWICDTVAKGKTSIQFFSVVFKYLFASRNWYALLIYIWFFMCL